MKLLIDIGNTATKVAIYHSQEMIYFTTLNQLSRKDIISIKNEFANISDVILSSVASIPNGLINYLQTEFITLIELDHKTPLPYKTIYKTTETLGKDRMAIVAGAEYLFPKQNVLAIDMGTAITYDFINKDGLYLGGNISPGMLTRYKSLNYYTKNLPLLSPVQDFEFIGNSTESAIVSGVQTGITFEIDGYINALKTKYKELKVVLSGGDCFFFAEKLKNTIFAERNIVLLGLNRILNFNILNNNND